MAHSFLLRRYSVVSRISGTIANSFARCSRNSGHHRALNSSPSPWLMLPPASNGGDMVYRFYNLAEHRVESLPKRSNRISEPELPDDECEFVGSSHGWLALFNPRNNDLFLSNPITRRHIKLPSIQSLPDPETNLTRDGLGSVSKVILSCCPDSTADADECRAMMTFGPGDRLAVCHPLRSTEWTPIGNLYFKGYNVEEWYTIMEYGRAYEDFVFCSRRKVFSCTTQLEIDVEYWYLNSPSEIEVWDLFSSEPKSSVYWIARALEGEQQCTWLNENKAKLIKSCRQIPYLVYSEQHDQLFVVIRFIMERAVGHSLCIDVDDIPCDPISGRLLTHLYPYKTIGFSVLKFDYERPRLTNGLRLVEGGDNSLHGLAMFVGMNHSFAVSGADELGLKPNSIYFTDSNKNPTLPPDSIYGGHDIGIFDYDNKTISPCYYPCDVPSLRKIVPAPMWFTPTPTPTSH